MTAALADMVGTLRIRTPRDEPAIRSAVHGAVRRTDLHPPGRAPHAVLVVRRLEHRLAWDAGMPTPTGPAGLAGEVDAMWRLAERPAAGPVSASAPAVIFDDLVDLLASFCEDAATDAVGDRWWWDVVRHSLSPATTVAEALGRHPTLVPQVLVELDRRAMLKQVLDAVGEDEAAALTSAVAEVHGAPRVARSVRRWIEASVPPVEEARSLTDASPTPRAVSSPERARDLLLSVSRLIAAGDPRVRSAAFADRLDRRLAADLGPAAGRSDPDAGSVQPVPAVADTVARPEHGSREAETSVRRRGITLRDRLGARAPEGASGTPPAATLPDGAGPLGAPAEPNRAAPGRSLPAHSVADGAVPSDGDRDVDVEPGPNVASDGAGVVTGLGGVFFLVDLLGELELPDVFEEPWRLASRLGGWGTLEVLARSLVAAAPPWPHDPIWRLLADLGGGFGALAPERSLPARARGSLPVAWRAMRLPHADGDVPPVDGSLAAGATQGLRRWLELVRPFVVDLLVERVQLPATELLQAVLVRPARIDVDRTHVDVVLPLSTASVPVRRAGLDRDPGWVPQLGRVVSFHFEPEPAGL